MAEFKPGDVVRVSPIKGPWMLVESCDGINIICFWFDKNDNGHRESFVNEFLELRKSETSGISGFVSARRKDDA